MIFEPYSNFFSLFIFFIILIPSIIFGVLGRVSKYYGMFTSLFVLKNVFFSSSKMKQFLLFILFECLLIFGYYLFNKRVKSEFVYFSLFLLSICPLLLVKVCAHSYRFSYIGFIGISYMSFKIWQLIVEIHDGHIDKLSLLDLLYFITFFPTISSGPIDRYQRFINNINSRISSCEYINDYFFIGMKKIFIGIFYKFSLSSLLHVYLVSHFVNDKSILGIIIYMYSYTLYLFFDFAGYSNLAIGTSYILGIKTPENFNKPFYAHNMKEFWDRWHISLSKWLGDYLFTRFILNTLRNGTFRSKKLAIRCGYLITMSTMGLWHGFHLFYLLYGIYHGITLILTDIYLKSKFYKKIKSKSFFSILNQIFCFNIVSFGMLIFSGNLVKI